MERCLFDVPSTNLHYQKHLHLQDGSCREIPQSHLDKYKDRGWQCHRRISKREKRINFDRQRYVGDPITWKVPFNVDGVRTSATPDSVIEASYFRVFDKRRNSQLAIPQPYYYMKTLHFEICIFKHTYTHCGLYMSSLRTIPKCLLPVELFSTELY